MVLEIDPTRDLVVSDIADSVAGAKAARDVYGPDATTAAAYW